MSDPSFAELNWPAITALIAAGGAASAPFLQGWWANRTSRGTIKAKASETEMERLERREREQYERTEEWGQRLEKENDALREECEECRNQRRGMEDWAHWQRHQLVNLIQRFWALVEIAEKAAEGAYAPERLAVILKQTRATMPQLPPDIPVMQDADKTRPPRSPA